MFFGSATLAMCFIDIIEELRESFIREWNIPSTNSLRDVSKTTDIPKLFMNFVTYKYWCKYLAIDKLLK